MGSHTAAPPQEAGEKLPRDTKKRLEARTQRDSVPRGPGEAGEGPWSSPDEEAASVWTLPSLLSSLTLHLWVLSTPRPPAPSTASPLQTEPVAAVDTDVHRDPLSSSGGPLHPAPPPGPPSSPSCAPALRAAHPILLVIPLSADPQQFYLLGSLRASPPGPSELSLNWHPCRCLLGR